MEEIIKKLENGLNLNFDESKSTFEAMMSGKVSEKHIYDFLIASSNKGETSEEIAGGVFVLRNKATKVDVPDNTIDTCGTGGDGKKYFKYFDSSCTFIIKFWRKSS